MTEPAIFPSLFGRFTAIRQDHEHLGTTLKRLRLMCLGLEARERAPLAIEPARLFEDLRTDLSGHFAAEEADSYFGTIAEEAPHLAHGIAQLRNEHAALLSGIAVLCRLAEDGTRAAELSGATQRLVAELEQHERAESRLLRELFVRRR